MVKSAHYLFLTYFLTQALMQSSRKLKSVEETPCRICLEDNNDLTISPCNCKGSVKMVHPACLQTWIQKQRTFHPSKITVQENGISKILCEICLQKIQFKFEVEKKCLGGNELISRIQEDLPSFICLMMWVGILGAASGFLLYLFIVSILNEESAFVMVFFIIFFVIIFLILLRMAQALIDLLLVEKVDKFELIQKNDTKF